ncbi:hypothetical protein M9H77_02804 [Catharanthus roseus]|uniref:Uncharacterized protein n=1 Tax=Catharanthus roseus TaxID=4058 RepID=A0ACC0C9H9_CATRO|nr:hypothetical protein M9H77_02804 [Catharanthus roseus]
MRRLAKRVLIMLEDPGVTLISLYEVAVTKGQKKTNSTKRDKSSGLGLGSGYSSGSRERGRPPRAPRGRGRECSRGRSSLSSVIDPFPYSTFPYTNAFPTFIYPLIENWKNVIGNGNCGYWVVADFVFGDEHQWPEVRRRMLYELEHTTNVYLSLLGSAERVYELVHRTQWQDGPAPLEHSLETSDSLYVIANVFNLCVILIAYLGYTTVLPLYSYSNHPGGTLVISLLTEQQHFIQMHDGCSIPPLHMQWIHHRSERVSTWADFYYDRIAYWNARVARNRN